MAAVQGFLQTLIIAVAALAGAATLGFGPHLGHSASVPALPPAVHSGATTAVL